MNPTTTATLILTAGAVLLGVSAVVVSRHATRWPELSSRIATVEVKVEMVEVVAGGARETADKARKIASARKRRIAAEPVELRESEPALPRAIAEQPPATAFVPGAGGTMPRRAALAMDAPPTGSPDAGEPVDLQPAPIPDDDE